ncbi:MAG: protein translocase subunit SecD [Candidatus Sumerlaeia bacterium]
MQRESNWRYYFIIAVTVLCLFFIFPTARYVTYVFTKAMPTQADYTSDGQLNAEAYNEAIEEYDDSKAKLQREAIKLGLDLIGGVDALIRVDMEKMKTKKLASLREQLNSVLRQNRIGARLTMNDARNALILKVDDKADARQASNVLSDWFGSSRSWFQPINEQQFFASGEATLRMRDDVFRSEVRDSIETAEKIIRDRVDEFGVTQPSVSLQSGAEGVNGIRVQVPGERDPEYVIDQIIKPAQLEFYALHDENETKVQQLFEMREVEGPHGDMVEDWVLKEGAKLPTGYKAMEGERVIRDETTPRTEKIMYIVKSDPVMTGTNLNNAYVQQNPASLTNPISVGITFNHAGAREFKQVTQEYLQKRVAIALDNKIYSAPVVQSVIPNGQAVIEGNFNPEEARDLALVLKAGALPADLMPDQSRAVGPTLGEESITESLKALALGASAIAIFMIIYYGTAGFIAIIALILNVLVILACLDLFNATLTLSGIGGIILTLGMAVDANVLIYERIREEMRNGRELGAAIRGGFGRAFSVIFDSNLTTLLAAFVLLQFGEGSVQGFALTMAFGLLANLFTGLTVTYSLCALWFRWRGKLSLGKLAFFRNTHFNFIGIRKASFTLSAIMIIGSIAYLGVNRGPQMAVDFEGGVMSDVRLANSTENETERLMQILPGGQAKVQKVTGSQNDYLVRLAEQERPEGSDASSDVEYTKQLVRDLIVEEYGAENVNILGTTSVSREVGQEFQQIALIVVISASFCILLYLWFRFEFVFGVAAVIALVHDLTITLGLITLLQVQISLDIVSALLILLGFSVNDTIVIFDRVRENSNSMYGKTFKEICNSAMNNTLSRTIITTGTTVGVMLIMFFFGGHSLQPFALTLIIGGLIGTYSSDFLATPLIYWWNERNQGRLMAHLERKGATMDSEAQAGSPAMAAPAEGPAEGPAGGTQANRPRRGRR